MERFPDSFPRERLEASTTAAAKKIQNRCPDGLLPNLIQLAWLLDKIEKALQKKFGAKARLSLNSAFRGAALNKAIGGSETSAHMMAFAADITCNVLNPHQLAAFIYTMGVEYDQLIQEFGRWVHIGLAKVNRKQNLTARKVAGKTVYLHGLMPV